MLIISFPDLFSFSSIVSSFLKFFQDFLQFVLRGTAILLGNSWISENCNFKNFIYHLLGDIFELVAILILSIILIFWSDVTYLDPFISIGIALWLIFNLGRTLYKSVLVLLQKTPDNFDVDEFKQKILDIDGIKEIDDFHIWSLDGIDSVMTLKVKMANWDNPEEIKKEIYSVSNEYHIIDITIELE